MPKWFYLFILALAIATAAGILQLEARRQAWEVRIETERAQGWTVLLPAEGDAHDGRDLP